MLNTTDAILFICSIATTNKEKFSKVKLNKSMFFSDLEYYLQYGNRLSDAEYTKHNHGPVIKNLDVFLNEMVDQKFIHIRLVKNQVSDGTRSEITCLKDINVNDDDKRYKKLEIITNNLIENYNLESANKRSHDDVYDFFEIGDVIDFEIARAIMYERTDEETLKWGSQFPYIQAL